MMNTHTHTYIHTYTHKLIWKVYVCMCLLCLSVEMILKSPLCRSNKNQKSISRFLFTVFIYEMRYIKLIYVCFQKKSFKKLKIVVCIYVLCFQKWFLYLQNMIFSRFSEEINSMAIGFIMYVKVCSSCSPMRYVLVQSYNLHLVPPSRTTNTLIRWLEPTPVLIRWRFEQVRCRTIRN